MERLDSGIPLAPLRKSGVVDFVESPIDCANAGNSGESARRVVARFVEVQSDFGVIVASFDNELVEFPLQIRSELSRALASLEQAEIVLNDLSKSGDRVHILERVQDI